MHRNTLVLVIWKNAGALPAASLRERGACTHWGIGQQQRQRQRSGAAAGGGCSAAASGYHALVHAAMAAGQALLNSARPLLPEKQEKNLKKAHMVVNSWRPPL